MSNIEGTSKLVEMIHEIGYHAKSNEDRFIRSKAGGYNILVSIFDDSIQLYSGFNFDKDRNVSEEFINNFNMNYRFGKIYKKDETLCLEQDFLFELSDVNAQDLLTRIYSLYEGCLALLSRELSQRATAEPSL